VSREGIRVGSVLGAPVLLRPSWFVVVGIVTGVFAQDVALRLPSIASGTAYLIAAAFALLLLGSVFLHELAHALTARAVGGRPTAIVLDVWGGHTAFSAELVSPGRSVAVAVAGPAANALLATTVFAVRGLVPSDGIANLLALALAVSNALVAAFNLLPGLPLDGGRILEGLVWAQRRERTAGTLAAGWAGRLVATTVAALAVVWPVVTRTPLALLSAVWLLLIAWLLWQGATHTIRVGQWRRRAPTVTVRALLRPATTVVAEASVADVLAHGVGEEDGHVVVVGVRGDPLALLDRSAVATVTPQRAPQVPVTAVSRALGDGAVLPEDLAGEVLVDRMQRAPHDEYAVVDAAGSVVGVLSWRAVAARVAGR
jgi:Zn-dependent protease